VFSHAAADEVRKLLASVELFPERGIGWSIISLGKGRCDRALRKAGCEASLLNGAMEEITHYYQTAGSRSATYATRLRGMKSRTRPAKALGAALGTPNWTRRFPIRSRV